MELIFTKILETILHEKSLLELIAVILSVAYLVLALRENIWCWPCALISTGIYIYLFQHVFLFMDAALNVYYMVMAVYGFWIWNKKTEDQHGHTYKIIYWSWRYHVIGMFLIVIATVVSGYILENNTQAAWPYLDSFTTWASVFTTYMVAKKVIENWLYWIVIDSVAFALYIDRGLYFTAMLFLFYVVIVIFGFFAWRKKYLQQATHSVLVS